MTELIDEWVNRSGLAIEFMGHFDFGDALELDHSVTSLRTLAIAVTNHFADPAEALQADRQPLVEGVVAYVGECLLRLTRGRWDWDDAPGFAERGRPTLANSHLVAPVEAHRWRFEDLEGRGLPLVHSDAALNLEPVSPLHVLLAQLGNGSPAQSGPLVTTFEHWQQTVSAYGTAHPEWTRVSAPTLTAGMPVMPDSPILDAWLARQRANFPRWAQTYGGSYDYAPDSLDALAALVFRTTPTMEAFEDPANANFAEGASWYFGELLCRAYPARWMYREYLREPGDPVPVCFTVQTNDNKDFTGPFVRISNMLRRRDPGWLRRGHDQWAANA